MHLQQEGDGLVGLERGGCVCVWVCVLLQVEYLYQLVYETLDLLASKR
jgi:hypothetical protein